MTSPIRFLAVVLLLAFSLASCGGDNSTQQGSQNEEPATTTSAEVSSCVGDADVQVPGADFQETACLVDLTTKGTQESGHTNPKDWAGLSAKETDNPSGVSGLQIDGYFPDDSSTNTNNEHNHDSQFVLRLPDEWNGKLVITGASGNRPQYANDFIMSDWLLDRGYAFASTDKGNTGAEFYETGENPGDSIVEWNYRVEELTRASNTVVERYYGQGPQFTYITGISNAGYLVRYALENTPELYDGGVDWEGNLFRAEGPNLLTYLPPAVKNYPEYADTSDEEAFRAIAEAGFPAESEFLWEKYFDTYWKLTLEIYRKEFDPGYEEAEEEYDYFARPQEVRDAVTRVQNTGQIGKPMITLHGTLDALLPIGESSDVYRDLVETVGRSNLHSYFVIEDGNHVDGFYDDYPDRIRPILPCYRAAFEALEEAVEVNKSLPPGGLLPVPEEGDGVNQCSLEEAT
ncbi:MAG TPA: tannase/feruloyl esterase family alpha/beta hydrolase [Rubrobacteraceae bacterium]|nr:tannase/feruloyl esterase family alpha/beta hydrolase [Rubrobacteraceae bacterium]